jgi:hypothetical protein
MAFVMKLILHFSMNLSENQENQISQIKIRQNLLQDVSVTMDMSI